MRATGFGADEGVAVDIDEAAFWYDLEFGAGRVFLDAVEDTFDRILDGPNKYVPKRRDIRFAQVRGQLRRSEGESHDGPQREFPYGVYFTIDSEQRVYVWAVASLQREPYYWLGRMDRA